MANSITNKVFALSLGQTLSTFVTVAIAVVMSRILTHAELATYRQTILAYQVALPLLSLGLTNSLYYFLPTEKLRPRGLVLDALIIMFAMGLIYAIIIALGGNHILSKRFDNPSIVFTLAYIAPLPIIMLPATLLSTVMIVQNRVYLLSTYNVASHLIIGISILGACVLWRTPESMVLTKVGVSLMVGAAAIYLMLKSIPTGSWQISPGNMKRLVYFGTPLAFASMLGSISVQLDKIIVSAMCTPEDFAIYSNGAFELPLVGIITGSVASVILPDLRRMVATGDESAALALFQRVAEKSILLIVPAMVFLFVSAEPFILTMFSAKYYDSIFPFRLYLLILPMRIVFFGPFLMALGMKRTILYRSAVGLAVNFVLSIILVKYMGFIGAIKATIFSLYFVEGAWCIISLSRSLKCKWWEIYPFYRLLIVLWISAIACIPNLILIYFSSLHSFVMLLANSVIFSIGFLGCTFLFGVEFIKNELNSLKKRSLNYIKP